VVALGECRGFGVGGGVRRADRSPRRNVAGRGLLSRRARAETRRLGPRGAATQRAALEHSQTRASRESSGARQPTVGDRSSRSDLRPGVRGKPVSVPLCTCRPVTKIRPPTAIFRQPRDVAEVSAGGDRLFELYRCGSGESARGVSRLVRSRPGNDLTAPTDDFAVIQDEDRDGTLAAELLDLCAVTSIRRPRPRPQTCALNPRDLVRVPGVVKCLRCPSARMGERGRRAAGELLQ
jgi:hypothetical protein